MRASESDDEWREWKRKYDDAVAEYTAMERESCESDAKHYEATKARAEAAYHSAQQYLNTLGREAHSAVDAVERRLRSAHAAVQSARAQSFAHTQANILALKEAIATASRGDRGISVSTTRRTRR